MPELGLRLTTLALPGVLQGGKENDATPSGRVSGFASSLSGVGAAVTAGGDVTAAAAAGGKPVFERPQSGALSPLKGVR